MAYAVATDVAVRLGRDLEENEVAQVEAFLDDAEQLIRVRFPNLDAQVEAGKVTAAAVVSIEAGAVRRLMLNPEGYAQETIDGWSGQRGSTIADGFLFITEAEWAALSPLIEVRRRGSIRLVANGELYPGQPYYPPSYS